MATKAELELENKTLAKENKNMSKNLTEMDEKLQLLTSQIQMLMANTNNIPSNRQDSLENRKIKVVSMADCPLTLYTELYGRGTEYEFMTFGSERNIRFDDLEKIVAVCRRTASDTRQPLSLIEKGIVYIADPEAVTALDLDEFYEDLPTKKAIKDMISLSKDDDIHAFSKFHKAIQESVVSMIIDNMNNKGKSYDLNRLSAIGEIYGKDIIELSRNAKKEKVR